MSDAEFTVDDLSFVEFIEKKYYEKFGPPEERIRCTFKFVVDEKGRIRDLHFFHIKESDSINIKEEYTLPQTDDVDSLAQAVEDFFETNNAFSITTNEADRLTSIIEQAPNWKPATHNGTPMISWQFWMLDFGR